MDKGWGFINRTGKIVIPTWFEEARPFSDGLAWVMIDGKAGYINKEGRLVIQPRFQSFFIDDKWSPWDYKGEGNYCFSEGLKAVQASEGIFGVIDRSGNWAISPDFSGILDFSQGLAQATMAPERKKIGFINKNGEWAILPQFLNAGDFAENLAAVQFNGGDWGYIDRNGSVVIPPRFESASPFSEGLAAVNGGAAFIDNEGNVVIQARPGFHQFGSFSHGRASFATAPDPDEGLMGFMDRNGKVVVLPKFRAVWSFSDGLAAIWLVDGKMGFIDLSGKLVIQPKFDSACSFSEGLAEVKDESLPDGLTEEDDWHGVWGFIDKTGTIVIKPQFYDTHQFSEGLAPVSTRPPG